MVWQGGRSPADPGFGRGVVVVANLQPERWARVGISDGSGGPGQVAASECQGSNGSLVPRTVRFVVALRQGGRRRPGLAGGPHCQEED